MTSRVCTPLNPEVSLSCATEGYCVHHYLAVSTTWWQASMSFNGKPSGVKHVDGTKLLKGFRARSAVQL